MRALTLVLEIALSRLSGDEYLNLMKRTARLVESATPEALGIEAAEFAEYKEKVDLLQQRVAYPTASVKTDESDEVDRMRDATLSYLFAAINAGVNLPIEAQREAAKALEVITRAYANIQRLPDQSETNRIDGLLLDLDTEEAKAHLATMGLTPIVAELKSLNERYTTLTDERTAAEMARTLPSATEIRAALDPMYTTITMIAFAESVTNPTETTANFINLLNATIKEVKKRHNLRTGKETDDDEKKDPTIPGTDTEIPENPDGQQPTNPDGEQPGEDQQPGGEQTTPDPDDNTPQPGVDNDGDGSPEVV